MKKILLGSIALCMLSISIIIFQVSCQKAVNAQDQTEQKNLILFDGEEVFPEAPLITKDSLGNTISTPRFRYESKFYVSNLDGTNQRSIPISLPAGLYASGNAFLTPDGNTLVFNVKQFNNPSFSEIYSVALNGSNLKKLVAGNHILKGVY